MFHTLVAVSGEGKRKRAKDHAGQDAAKTG
jgi:hypothetical protein